MKAHGPCYKFSKLTPRSVDATPPRRSYELAVMADSNREISFFRSITELFIDILEHQLARLQDGLERLAKRCSQREDHSFDNSGRKEPSQTATPAATSAQPPPTSSIQHSSSSVPTTASRLKLNTLASRTKSLLLSRLGKLLVYSGTFSLTCAADVVSPQQPGPTWPFYVGPSGLWDFLFAVVVAIIIIVAPLWAEKFMNPARGWLLLLFSTLSSFFVMNDGTTSLTILLR